MICSQPVPLGQTSAYRGLVACHVLKSGTPELRTAEHRGTPRNTPEHNRTPEHRNSQKAPAGTPNLTVLFCFPITDHVKIECQCNLFTQV